MENLSKRLPLINKYILKNLDEKSLANYKEASRGLNKVLYNEKFYWIKILNQYKGSFKEFKDAWKKVIFKSPVCKVKKLTLATNNFFQEKQERHKKQWHPLFIAAQQGSLELCKFIIENTREFIPRRTEDGITPLDLAAQGGHLKIY